jgi:hypothetical protein
VDVFVSRIQQSPFDFDLFGPITEPAGALLDSPRLWVLASIGVVDMVGVVDRALDSPSLYMFDDPMACSFSR